MFRRKCQKESYDKENLKPVLRSSICNGEQVAGFKDIRTGRFTEIMLIRSSRDMDIFLERYDISPNSLPPGQLHYHGSILVLPVMIFR